jgi:hypothetical protein
MSESVDVAGNKLRAMRQRLLDRGAGALAVIAVM